MPDIPAGWYDDPLGSTEERFWDGSNWTNETRSPSSATKVSSTTDDFSSDNSTDEGHQPSRSRSGFVALLSAALVVMSAVATVLFLNRGSSPAAQTQRTTESSSVSTITVEAVTTTAPAVGTTTSGLAMTVTTTTAPPVTTTSGPIETVAQLRITPSMVTATCQGNDGLEGDLVTPVRYSAENLVDGVRSTAWRCATDEVLAGSIEIDLRVPTKLTEVSLIAGYDKVDPFNDVDRFIQNHRVARAKWTFDDSSVTVDYVDSRDVQSTEVDVTTQIVRLEILDYWPSSGTLARDMIAFSEIVLWGIR